MMSQDLQDRIAKFAAELPNEQTTRFLSIVYEALMQGFDIAARTATPLYKSTKKEVSQ